MVSVLKDVLLERFVLDEGFLEEIHGQLILTVPSKAWLSIATQLKSDPECSFEMLIDLAGIDYSMFKNSEHDGLRFGVVYQLLSITHNHRLRVKVLAENDNWPVVPTVTCIWSSANWYEREAYDLYGILFEGHTDLRRILTDYGFVGHPFRKDFPLSGYVEMRYDPEQKRVIYQPVTVEPRENTPRVVREEQYARPIQ